MFTFRSSRSPAPPGLTEGWRQEAGQLLLQHRQLAGRGIAVDIDLDYVAGRILVEGDDRGAAGHQGDADPAIELLGRQGNHVAFNCQGRLDHRQKLARAAASPQAPSPFADGRA